VLDRLVSDRRVSPGEITRYVSEMHREISDLEQRLQSLRHAAGAAISTVLSKVGVSSAPRAARRRGRPAGSGKAAAAAATPAAATGAVKRGPGRPPGSGAKKRGPGRPKGSSKAAAAPAANAASAPSSTPATPAKRGRKRRSAITPEQLASRQLQGRYLGLIRQVPASKRAQYQKIAKEKGREAAIRELQDAVKK
jgi:hypothetical protein